MKRIFANDEGIILPLLHVHQMKGKMYENVNNILEEFIIITMKRGGRNAFNKMPTKGWKENIKFSIKIRCKVLGKFQKNKHF